MIEPLEYFADKIQGSNHNIEFGYVKGGINLNLSFDDKKGRPMSMKRFISNIEISSFEDENSEFFLFHFEAAVHDILEEGYERD